MHRFLLSYVEAYSRTGSDAIDLGYELHCAQVACEWGADDPDFRYAESVVAGLHRRERHFQLAAEKLGLQYPITRANDPGIDDAWNRGQVLYRGYHPATARKHYRWAF